MKQNEQELSSESPRQQFKSVMQLLRGRITKLLETPRGRNALRVELGKMQGVPPEMVKLEGFPDGFEPTE